MHFTTIFIWFVLYSILGWIYETIYCSVKTLKWDNRGMLIGPYCPIYGVGAVLDVLVCGGLPNYGAVFLTCMLGSAVLEYTTSYATEKLFHAVWWDYSDLPLNIKGRICLPCSLGFGAAGIIVLYGIHPYMSRITDSLPLYWQEPVALLLMAVFSTDCAITADRPQCQAGDYLKCYRLTDFRKIRCIYRKYEAKPVRRPDHTERKSFYGRIPRTQDDGGIKKYTFNHELEPDPCSSFLRNFPAYKI